VATHLPPRPLALPDHFRSSRRIWKPNAQWVRLWSDALETKLRLKVTTKALKVIDKRGGLDKYLLETRPVMLGRGKPQALRELVKKTMAERVARGEPATWLEALKAERGSGVAASGSADDLEDGPGIVDVDMPEAADAVPEERA